MRADAAMLEKAILFATEKHKGIRRKGDGKPYILHPMAVMMILFSLKDSNNKYLLAVVAILHDVVEDCDVTLAEIRRLFGYAVAALLEEVTTDKKKCEQMGKTAYLCMRVLEMTSYGLRIKLADRLHNCSDLKNMSQKFRDNYIPQTQEIIRTLETQRRLTKTHKYLVGKIKLALKKAAK